MIYGTMPTPARTAFVLAIVDAWPNDPEVTSATNRLKRALKTLLRTHGLRCVRAELAPVPPIGKLASVFTEPDVPAI